MEHHDSEVGAIDALFSRASLAVAHMLSKALEDQDLAVEEIAALFEVRGADLILLQGVADALRSRQVGETVTYVVNRNINFTNVCIKRCGFCAFSRSFRQEEGYFLPMEEVVRRAQEAVALGATEICVQAGLSPKLPGDYYIRLTETIKAALPDLHLHAFSPEEVLYGSARSRRPVPEYLAALKEAGVGSLPGTSAEILVQAVRDQIAPGRITADQWESVIRAAHALGIPTTATIMYGHVESAWHRALHLAKIREIQQDTGGFTEFVPLSFVHTEAPMWLKSTVPETRPGPTGNDILRMYAISRVVLGRHLKNIQASWVKEGMRMAQVLLGAGVNDLGGTLINESISTSAGAGFGQLVRPSEFRSVIQDAGRTAAERNTLYQVRKLFDGTESVSDVLDEVDDSVIAGFGSYRQLIHNAAYRYHHPLEVMPASEA